MLRLIITFYHLSLLSRIHDRLRLISRDRTTTLVVVVVVDIDIDIDIIGRIVFLLK